MKTNSSLLRVLLTLALALGVSAAQGQIQISSVTNTGYSQDFNTLATNGTANAWTQNSTLPGWYADQTKSPFTIANYRASTGSDNTGALYSFGSTASGERALGSLPTSTPGDIAFGIRFTNNTSLAMSNIVVSYTGEQWRRVTGAATQTLAFAFAVSSSGITSADPADALQTWVSASALNFQSPNLGATGLIDGNASTNRQSLSGVLAGVLLLPGQELFLRWLDVDDASVADCGMGIDDLTVTFTPVNFSNPGINAQPGSRTNVVFTTATFSVAATGLSALSYQWYKGASPLSNGGNIAGATNATLTLSQVIHADAGAYSVVVTNNSGSVTSTVANLTVIGFAIAPVPPTNTLAGTPVTVPLAFIDTVSVSSAAGSSSNQVILPNANISAAAAGSSGSATLTPVAGTGGVVLTSLTASDGSFSTNTVFSLLVVPSTNVVFNDQFDYVNGPVTAGSIGLWANHSGPAGQLAVSNGALRVSASFDEDASVALLGQPYTTTSPAVLYSRFILNVKSPTDLPGVVGNYFAHFRGAASTSQRARVWISTTNAAAGKFRLGIGNGSASSNLTAQVEQDLEPGTNYVVITRLVVSNAVSSIWINPASETDTNSLLFDTAEDVPTTTSDIIAYAFRQESTGGSTSEGNITVDNLVVGTSFAAVAGSMAPTPVPLTITTAAGKAIVSWTDGSGLFKLATGTNVLQVTNIISGATSPYTNGISGSQTYFRLVYP